MKISSNPEAPEKLSRREFFQKFFTIPKLSTKENTMLENRYVAFLEMVQKCNIPRRQFLALMGLISGLVGIGALGVDQLMFDGALQDLMLQALAKPELREKLLEIVIEGKAPQKLREEFFEKMTPYVPDYKLGKKESFREQNLDLGFSSYEIRHVVGNGEEKPQLLLVATMKKNGAVVVTEKTQDNRVNLTTTQEKIGSFFTIPSSQLTKQDDGTVTISSYASFETQSDQPLTFGLSNKKISSGALILLRDGEIITVDGSEIDAYITGKNCKAVYSFVLAVHSKTLSHDMASIDSAMFRRTSVAGISAVPYECFIATFYSLNGMRETKIISVYEPPSSSTTLANRSLWYTGLSIEQCVSLCKQLQEEGKFDRFTFIVPDPHYIHSKLIGPFENPEEKTLRVFGKDMPGTYIEANNPFLKYYPPVFLALKVGK